MEERVIIERQESFAKLLEKINKSLCNYPLFELKSADFNVWSINANKFVLMRDILRLILEYQQEYPNLEFEAICSCNKCKV